MGAATVTCVRCGTELLPTHLECPQCGLPTPRNKSPETVSGAESGREAPTNAQPQGFAPGTDQTRHNPSRGQNPPLGASHKFCLSCGERVLRQLHECPNCSGARFSNDPVAPRPRGGIEAPPVIERNETNIVSRSERERDRIYDELTAACDAEGVYGMLLKSHPFNPAVWVSCECWLPHEKANSLRERVSAVITIRGREYYRFEFEIDIEIKRGERSEIRRSIIQFDQSTARMLVRYLLHRIDSVQFRCCTASPFRFWQERNKPKTKTDPLAIAGSALVPIGLLLLVIPGTRIVGALCFVAAAGCLVGAYYRRNRVYVVSAGKPSQEPRKLVRMDSWQTLVNGLARDVDRVKVEITAALSTTQPDGARLSQEKIWYRGVDGKVEREQLVVTFRRAITFIHIYPDGNDLYVGWDAHVNGGTWIERRVGIGRDPATGAACQLNTIVAGWQTPNEYDVIDGSTLIERVHAAVTQIIKRIMAERQIDQDIDFKILRERREGIAGHAEVAAAASTRSGLIRFRRES